MDHFGLLFSPTAVFGPVESRPSLVQRMFLSDVLTTGTDEIAPQEFDEKVLFIAPASATSDELETIGEVDLSLLPSVAMMDKYKELKKSSRLYRVVLFHAEWSMKSRELEMILSGMSCSCVPLASSSYKTDRFAKRFSSPTLEFNILTTESCPTTFYDLELSIYPSSLDLPVLYLYHQGELIGRLPGEGEFKELKVEDEGIDSVDEGEESEDERDVERRKGMERMRWDRSSVRPFSRASFLMIADSYVRRAEIDNSRIRPAQQIRQKVRLVSS